MLENTTNLPIDITNPTHAATERRSTLPVVKNLDRTNIHELTEVASGGILIVNVGAEGMVSVSTKKEDKTLNVGPDEPNSLQPGRNKPQGEYYVHKGPLSDIRELYPDVTLNPDLVLVVCPHPGQRGGVLKQVREIAGSKTSVVVVLESESHEMQRYDIDDVVDATITSLSRTFGEVDEMEVEGLDECLQYLRLGAERPATVTSRMNHADDFRYVVAKGYGQSSLL